MWFLFKKPLSSIQSVRHAGIANNLKAFDLIIVGIGAMIGCGVFTVTGIVAAEFSGPAVVASYAIGGFATILIALPYAELASMLPTSGSIYSYSQVAFGEVFGWIALSVLALELVFGSVCSASAIGSYMVSFLDQIFHVQIPAKYLAGPFDGGIFNMPASIVVIFFGFLTLVGGEGKSLLGTILVAVKILTVALFVVLAVPHFDVAYFTPFMPFGGGKVFAGAAILFTAFSGFSVIPTLSDYCRNPGRDITLGILGSVVLTLLIYVVVAVLFVGLGHYSQLNSPDALMRVLISKGSYYGVRVLSSGIVLAIIAVFMILLQATARIFMVASKDGLLPAFFQRVSIKGKPTYGILFCTVLFAILAGTIKFEATAQTASMGTLADYIIAMVLVLFFRKRYPYLDRKFRCPFVYLLVCVSILISIYLLYQQVVQSKHAYWKISIYWVLGFFAFYWAYGLLRNKNNSVRTVR